MTAGADSRPPGRLARIGLYAFGVLWLLLGAAIVVGVLAIGIDDPVSRTVVGGLLAVDGAMFVVAGRLFARHGRSVDVGVAGLVAVNAVLTVADQVGPLDVAAFVLLGGLLALIVRDMRTRRGV